MSRFLLLMLSLCMVAWADASRIAVGRGTPEMDGALTDDGWKNAIAAGPFLLDQQNAFATQQTVVRFLWDDEMLYVAFQCYEDVLNPRQNKLHAFRNAFAKPVVVPLATIVSVPVDAHGLACAGKNDATIPSAGHSGSRRQHLGHS